MNQKSVHRCPFCFAALPEGVAFRVCPAATKDDGSRCASAEPKPVRLGTTEESVTRRCPDHDTVLADCCYAQGCQKVLPNGWSEVTTTALAMAGTRSSGKTVYLAVTARLLMGWGRQQSITVSHYDAASRRSFELRFGELDPRAPLYGASEPEIPGGQVVRHQEPVLLRLQSPERTRNHVLVLRDVAGENVQDAVMDRSHFRFLSDADGLVFLVDPSESSEIQQSLRGVVDLPTADFDPDAVWGNLEQLQNAVNGLTAELVPTAVVLSKFDLITLAAEQQNSNFAHLLSAKGSRMLQDPSLRTPHFDLADSDLLDLELRTLHKHLGNSVLNRHADISRRRSQVRMFAVSSLGQNASMGRVSKHGVIPFRCLDPLKWFLAEAGVIGMV